MPLTPRGKKIMKSMKEQYGKKKGEQVFYATKNKGKLKGVEKAYLGKAVRQPTETKKEFEMRHAYHKPFMKKPKGFRGGDAAKSDAASGRSAGRADPSQGVDRSAVGAGSQYSRNKAEAALAAQRKQTIKQLTPPSQTLAGQALKYGLMFSGVPFAGTLTSKMIDRPYWSRSSKKTTKDTTPKDRDGPQQIIQPVVTPVQATKPVDTDLISPKDNFFNFVAYKTGGLSGGVRYGPPPKRGPNSQVPPVKMKKGGYKK